MNVNPERPCPALDPLPPWQGVCHGPVCGTWKGVGGGRGCWPHFESPLKVTEKCSHVTAFTPQISLHLYTGRYPLASIRSHPCLLSRAPVHEDSLFQKHSLSTYLATPQGGRNKSDVASASWVLTVTWRYVQMDKS
uniref:Uncharacterized protein n=1 Tax=Pipistrellus kuhlii TaxID=59472 RepID=A0A7J7W359_PIPKU|nr:hypothetical protein mPipKuh1_008141 [Pipistrellus kuhlii]